MFLNIRGTNPEKVSPEQVELEHSHPTLHSVRIGCAQAIPPSETLHFLHYLESITQEAASKCQSPWIQELQERIQIIKSNEEVGVKCMQAQEERELELREARREARRDALQQGRKEGRREGEQHS